MKQVGALVDFKQHLYDLQRDAMKKTVQLEQEEARLDEERRAAEEAKDLDNEAKTINSKDEDHKTNSLDVTPHENSSKALLTGRDPHNQTHGQVTEGKERPVSDLGMLSSQHNETVVSRS